VGSGRSEISRAAENVILLDTNALIWVEQGHRRAKSLLSRSEPLYVSPASLLELVLLEESGRIRLKRGLIDTLTDDSRWILDDPPAWPWFASTTELSWTRDPFDRLLVAHIRMRRWRLATSDSPLLAHLGEHERLAI
jgi:PIN domain nuclease of toxin-antitoxin system